MGAIEVAGRDAPSRVELEFVGEAYRAGEREMLEFGGRGDIVVDGGPYLHPYVGRVSFMAGSWWLTNLMPRSIIRVRDSHSRSIAVVDGGSAFVLLFRRFVVEFTAGPTTYQINGTIGGDITVPSVSTRAVENRPAESCTLTLTPEQHILLVALAEYGLHNPPTLSVPVPPTQVLAKRLGWSVTKINRKLDYLCSKISRTGVRNLKGGYSERAIDRRAALVDLAITLGWVSRDDLLLLEQIAR